MKPAHQKDKMKLPEEGKESEPPFSLHNKLNTKLTFSRKYHQAVWSFLQKRKANTILGLPNMQNTTNVISELGRVRMAALGINRLYAKGMPPPNPEARKATIQAGAALYQNIHQMIDKGQLSHFPLAGKNKCLGMVVVPGTKLVLIALSQDKNPDLDIELRAQMKEIIHQVNKNQASYTFELVNIPTTSQYFVIRTLGLRVPHDLHEEDISPRTRCVEVALMAALNKTGRLLKFNIKDFCMLAFSATPWQSNDLNQPAIALKGFEGLKKRNQKYVEPDQFIPVRLADSKMAYLDIWSPCEEHCKKYMPYMRAIAAAGGNATSFSEPRGDITLLDYASDKGKSNKENCNLENLKIGETGKKFQRLSSPLGNRRGSSHK